MSTDAQREAVARALEQIAPQAWGTDDYLKAADEIIAAMNAPTHRHRKGGLYHLIGYGPHTETGELFAIYRGADGKLWPRPAAMFDDGRFTPIEPKEPVP